MFAALRAMPLTDAIAIGLFPRIPPALIRAILAVEAGAGTIRGADGKRLSTVFAAVRQVTEFRVMTFTT